MNSYQLKQTARSRRNNAQKVQRPSLNFKASKDKAKDGGDNDHISDHASGGDNDDMSFVNRSDESDNEHCSFESMLKLVDSDVHDEMKDKFLKFTNSYDV
jgi:hypothetical protein